MSLWSHKGRIRRNPPHYLKQTTYYVDKPRFDPQPQLLSQYFIIWNWSFDVVDRIRVHKKSTLDIANWIWNFHFLMHTNPLTNLTMLI